MNHGELIQKLVKEVVTQRVLLRALVPMLAAHFHPDDAPEVSDQLTREWSEMYQELRPLVVADMAKDLGIPLSPELQADMGLTAEFEMWFRRESGESDS